MNHFPPVPDPCPDPCLSRHVETRAPVPPPLRGHGSGRPVPATRAQTEALPHREDDMMTDHTTPAAEPATTPGASDEREKQAQHFAECDCHDSWDQCPCADGHPTDGSCGCCGDGLCGRLGVGADSDADAAFIAASRVAVPALIAEVRALRETVARLNRRSQVAEAAIADLTREPIGGRKHKPVAAEVWTRCEESHGRGCRTTREAREEAERLRAEVERLRSEMAAKTADSALLLGFLGGAYDERDGARDGLVDLTARLAEQTRLTEQAREWAVRWQGEAERLRAGIESEIARRDETASRQEQAQLGSARRAWFDRLADQGRAWAVQWQGEAERLAAGIETLAERIERAELDPSDDARTAGAVIALDLRALLTPLDAQEGTQEARTGVAGVGVPSGTPEGRSGAEGGA